MAGRASAHNLHPAALPQSPWFWMGVTAARCVLDRRVKPALTGCHVTAREGCSVTTVPAIPETLVNVWVRADVYFPWRCCSLDPAKLVIFAG